MNIFLLIVHIHNVRRCFFFFRLVKLCKKKKKGDPNKKMVREGQRRPSEGKSFPAGSARPSPRILQSTLVIARSASKKGK
jgi:hypothetical protein